MSTPKQIAAAMLERLPSKDSDRCARALDVLLPALDGGEIYNAEFSAAKGVLDRAYDAAFNAIVRTDYTTYWDPPGSSNVSARGQLSNDLSHPMGLRSSIAAQKRVAKTKIHAPNLPELRALLAAVVPFAELMEKLKARVKKGKKPAAGPSSKEKRESARVGGSHECQICSGSWAIVKGKISLHGYKRPGIGFIEGRCMGANELPYAVSCDVLRKYIARLKQYLANTLDALTDLITATEVRLLRNRYDAGKLRLVSVAFRKADDPSAFEMALNEKRRDLEGQVNGLNHEIATQEKRLAAWRPPV